MANKRRLRADEDLVVHTLSGVNITATRPTRCANCTECLGVVGAEGCIYGGPHTFVEYGDVDD